MPTLSDLFNLDPNVERLSLLPRMRGSLPSDYGVSPEMMGSVMLQDPRVKNRFMPDLVAPKIIYDFIRAIKAPGRAARGEVLDEEEALNTAFNMFGGGLATSGSVPIGALGMSARTAPAGTMPLKEVAKSPLGFYSKVEEATLPLQNKGTGSQYLAQIEKTPGVKPEELEYTGLADFLRSKQTVTKPEIQDYLAANRVDLQEVRLGGLTPEAQSARDKLLEQYRSVTDELAYARQLSREGVLSPDESISTINSLALRRNHLDASINDLNRFSESKFSSYTIPGGENYREILLTLPAAKAFDKTSPAMQQMASEMYGANNVGRLSEGQWEIVAKKAQGTLGQEFKSSHFDQPNILAHMRVNDRVVDGKKTLFIEEVQSDWHQAGRKKGYDTPQARAAEQQKLDNILTERQSLLDEQRRLEELALPYTSQGKDAPSDIVDRWSVVSNRINNLQTEQNRLGRTFGQGVPDAPFKTTWHELSLKRAIQEASEKGYDQIAFTTGKTQAERYDLSKQIKTIIYGQPDENGLRRVEAITPNGDRLLGKKYSISEIEDNVGKEIADKISKSAGEFDQRTGTYAMSGLDLQVGGEGMKGFYDQILPKSLEKLGKKFNAKVGKTNMDETEVWKMDITPQMRESVLTKGQPLFAGSPAFPIANQDPLMQFLGMGEAENDPLMQFLGQK